MPTAPAIATPVATDAGIPASVLAAELQLLGGSGGLATRPLTIATPTPLTTGTTSQTTTAGANLAAAQAIQRAQLAAVANLITIQITTSTISGGLNLATTLALAQFQASLRNSNLANFANSGFVAFNDGVINTALSGLGLSRLGLSGFGLTNTALTNVVLANPALTNIALANPAQLRPNTGGFLG
jgi:hypothetical protein